MDGEEEETWDVTDMMVSRQPGAVACARTQRARRAGAEGRIRASHLKYSARRAHYVAVDYARPVVLGADLARGVAGVGRIVDPNSGAVSSVSPVSPVPAVPLGGEDREAEREGEREREREGEAERERERERENNKKTIGGHRGMILDRFRTSWKVF